MRGRLLVIVCWRERREERRESRSFCFCTRSACGKRLVHRLVMPGEERRGEERREPRRATLKQRLARAPGFADG